MLTIPAIDIYYGKVARLHKGNFATAKLYSYSPLEYAKQYDSIGARWLHLVDLAASLDGKITVGNQVKEIKGETKLLIEFGGGIKSFETAEKVFDLGVDRIVIGSISVSEKKEFERIISKYGKEKIVVATDSKDEMILIKGWTEKSYVTLWDHLEYCIQAGINYFLCTDISKDGTLASPNIELYKRIMEKHPGINLIASGGVGSIKDLKEIKDANIYASVVGKALYENKITLEELKQFVS